MNIDKLTELEKAQYETGKINYVSGSWIDKMLKSFPKTKSTIRFLEIAVAVARKFPDTKTRAELQITMEKFVIPCRHQVDLYEWYKESPCHRDYLDNILFQDSLKYWFGKGQINHFNLVAYALVCEIMSDDKTDIIRCVECGHQLRFKTEKQGRFIWVCFSCGKTATTTKGE